MADNQSLVVVANRLPARRTEDGGAWVTSPGGLVSALTPILQGVNGCWVGWTGEVDDAPPPFEHDGIIQRAVPISAGEVRQYYRGFCNGTLWPLYHNAVRTPEFHRHWWWPYLAVNRRFAEEAAEALRPGDVAWVHDYQLQLVPGLLRELQPDATVGFFLHIPFPPVELFGQLPWREEILSSLLSADVVAFQSQRGLDNFVGAVGAVLGVEPVDGGFVQEGRRVRLQRAPISIDTANFERLAACDDIRARAERLRSRVHPCRRIVLGVDRLDYTKGIEIRLRAFATLLERFPDRASDCVFIQVAVPSREEVPEYVQVREDIERLVGRINGIWGRPGRVPIVYMYRSLAIEDLVAYYLAADVMLVTPLADGMNLVAKEYVAARTEDTGVLVLSEFTGAAEELEEALIVNPRDVDGLAATVARAVRLPEDELARRMMALRKQVREHDVFDWAQDCLAALGL